jgi:hypothetical protein
MIDNRSNLCMIMAHRKASQAGDTRVRSWGGGFLRVALLPFHRLGGHNGTQILPTPCERDMIPFGIRGARLGESIVLLDCLAG